MLEYDATLAKEPRMSSILSHIKNGHWQLSLDDEHEPNRPNYQAMAEFLAKDACSHKMKLVNMQSVADDLIPGKTNRGEEYDIKTVWSKLPPVTPCHEDLWMECTIEDVQFAFQVHRADVQQDEVGSPARWSVNIAKWEAAYGVVIGPTVLYRFFLLESGQIQTAGLLDTQALDLSARLPDYDDMADLKSNMTIHLFAAISALGRMNCKNVELRPIGGLKSNRHRHHAVPASVWHEVTVTSIPKIRSAAQTAAGEGDPTLRRHWIRGHYADYRDGPGLFGNPSLRCVFWIPEHERGDPNLGEVVSEYKVI